MKKFAVMLVVGILLAKFRGPFFFLFIKRKGRYSLTKKGAD